MTGIGPQEIIGILFMLAGTACLIKAMLVSFSHPVPRPNRNREHS